MNSTGPLLTRSPAFIKPGIRKGKLSNNKLRILVDLILHSPPAFIEFAVT